MKHGLLLNCCSFDAIFMVRIICFNHHAYQPCFIKNCCNIQDCDDFDVTQGYVELWSSSGYWTTEHRTIWQIHLFNIFQKVRESETYHYGKSIHWKDNPFFPLLMNVNIKDLKKHKNLKKDNRLQGKTTNFTKILKYFVFACRSKSFSPNLTGSQKML